MGTKKCPHKYKDFGYCHLCGDILFPFVGFTRPYTHRIDTPPPTAFPMFPSHTRERFGSVHYQVCMSSCVSKKVLDLLKFNFFLIGAELPKDEFEN